MSEKQKMRIGKTVSFKADAADEILSLFWKGIDIVIIEQPRGLVIQEGVRQRGARCDVFIRGNTWTPFKEKLWHFTNWRKVTHFDRRFQEFLGSMYDYARVVKNIRKCFPEIEFEEIFEPKQN